MALFRKFTPLVLIAAAVVALDQYTKWLVRTHLAFTGMWLPAQLDWLRPYARIIYWDNSGAAFGMFQNGSLVFTVLAFIVIGVIFYYYPRVAPEDWWLRLAMGMQLGGAVGNLVDRLTRQGKVTDFISISTFPVFNVADSSISVGVLILLAGVWWKERREKQAAAAGVPQAADAEGSQPAQGQ